MRSNYILYWSIWCPLEEVRDCIKKSQPLLKEIIEYLKDYDNEEGIVFLELTEESLKNLPAMMVDNMKCFSKYNIDTMVFHTKEIKCTQEKASGLKEVFEDYLENLCTKGFKSEMLMIKETKNEEENIGKTVGRKKREVWYHRLFA